MSLRFVCLFLTVLLATKAAKDLDGIFELNQEDFNSFFEQNEKVLVMMYAPWCGHCKNMLPEFEKAGKDLKSKQSEMVLAKMDATPEGFGEKFNIEAFPTMLYFYKGQHYKCDPGHQAQAIYQWANAKSSFQIKVIDVETYKSLNVQENVKVVLHDSEHSGYYFGIAFKDPANEYLRVEGDTGKEKGTVQILRSFGENKLSILNNWSLARWIRIHDGPAVKPFDQKVYTYYDAGLPLALLLGQSDQNIISTFEKVAASITEQQGLLAFTALPQNHQAYNMNQQFLTTNPDLHPVVIVNPQTMKKYIFYIKAQQFTEENFKNFCQQFLKEEVEGFSLEAKLGQLPGEEQEVEAASQEEEVSWQIDENSPIVTLDDENFNSKLKENSHLFVMFYATWCGHCQSLKPTFDKLANQLRDENKKVKMGRVDAVANKELAQKFDVKGFPTLIYFSEGNNYSYKGGRQEENLYNFLTKKAENPIQVLTIEEYKNLDYSKGVKIVLHAKRNHPEVVNAAIVDSRNEYFRVEGVEGKMENDVELLRSFDENIHLNAAGGELDIWVALNDHQIIVPFSTKIYAYFQDDMHVVFSFGAKSRGFYKHYEKVARDLRDEEYLNIYTNLEEEDQKYSEIVGMLNIKPELHPIVIIEPNENKKIVFYTADRKLDFDGINSFFRGVDDTGVQTLDFNEAPKDSQEESDNRPAADAEVEAKSDSKTEEQIINQDL